MTVIETTPTVDRTTEFVNEDGDHDKEAHIVVPAHKVYEAMVMGVPVTAICGKTWVPTRAPDNFGTCKRCIEVWEAETGKEWKGPR